SGSGVFNPNANILNPIYNPSTADTTAGSVTLVLTAGGTGACLIVTDSVKITFTSAPKANFIFTNKCINTATSFTDTSTPTNSVLQNPYHTYKDTGTYFVTLTVMSDSGCVAAFLDTIHVTACGSIDIPIVISNPAVPSGFSPNGDGKNDFLYVKGGPFKEL